MKGGLKSTKRQKYHDLKSNSDKNKIKLVSNIKTKHLYL